MGWGDHVRAGALVALGCAALAWAGAERGAHAVDFQPHPSLKMSWNNTLKYTTAARVGSHSGVLLANINGDDGDRRTTSRPQPWRPAGSGEPRH